MAGSLSCEREGRGYPQICLSEPVTLSGPVAILTKSAGGADHHRPLISARCGLANLALQLRAQLPSELLAADVQLIGDGGGNAPQWARAIAGAENVARMLAAIGPAFTRIGGAVEPHEINGQPGAIFRDRDNKVLNTWTLDVLDGRIQTIRSVINPDKLGHVGPLADAWAVYREANQARRPTD